MPVEEGELLAAVRRVVGRIQVDRDPPRPPVQPVLMPLDDPHRQLARQLVESGPADTVLEPRDRRLRGQRLAGDRVPPEQQLVDRVVGEVVGVVAIGMTAGNAEDPLAEPLRQRVPDLPELPPVHQTPGETRHQPIHALRRLEQHSATIGTRVLAVERRDEGLVEEIRKEDSLWYLLRCHAGASVVGKWLCQQHLYHAEIFVFLPISDPS